MKDLDLNENPQIELDINFRSRIINQNKKLINTYQESIGSFVSQRKSYLNKLAELSNKKYIEKNFIVRMNFLQGKNIHELNHQQTLPKGNFYYPLKKNFNPDLLENITSNCVEYVDDDKVDKVKNSQERVILIDKSLIRISSFVNKLTYNLKNKGSLFEFGNILNDAVNNLEENEAQDFKDEVFELLNQITDQFPKKMQFKYLSVKLNEELNIKTILQTAKQMFCLMCCKFSCNLHFIDENRKHYISQLSDKNTMLKSLYLLLSSVSCVKYEKIPLFIVEHVNNFNKFIDNKKTSFSSKKIIFELNNINQQSPCSENCYLVGNEISNYLMEFIVKEYVDKFFSVFNFDPCKIHKCIKTTLRKKQETLPTCFEVIF